VNWFDPEKANPLFAQKARGRYNTGFAAAIPSHAFWEARAFLQCALPCVPFQIADNWIFP